MSATTLFISIICILIFSFLLDTVLNILNAKHYNNSIPKELVDVYDAEAYKKSQSYKKTNYKFGLLTSSFSLTLTLAFLIFGGFEIVDVWARQISDNSIVIALVFFGIIALGSDLLTTPFSYYQTFVIEERFGFNKTTKKTFILDKLKGLVMTVILGGGILTLIMVFYRWAQLDFWWYTWIFVSVFSVLMNMFYAKLIVPIFNKQQPLEDNSLRHKISIYAESVGFKLENIFVIDGSKRSTKANAYFSGFGSQKRITLYDNLISDLEEEEIVAVLAHEVGHYKRKHIVYNLILSILLTGLTLYILSLCIAFPELSYALGVSISSFHVGLVAFALLYSPVSEITGLFMNLMSRRFEYEADDYAKATYDGKALINALKKLSKNSLSNLTPHPAYVWMHYSHPSLLRRVKNLRN